MDPFNAFFHLHSAPTPSHQPSPAVGAIVDNARLTEIEFKVERLALISHALWDLLKDRHGYTDEELNDWINLTDLKDGRLDGRYKANTPPLNCPKCGRVVGRTQGRCIYCGGIASPAQPFDRVG